jgi:lipopolysaccharide/colanic/teichoic acid biosynthesis glycosyltransferase
VQLSTSIASDIDLATPPEDHARVPHISLVPSPDGTVAAAPLVVDRANFRQRFDAALIRTIDASVASILLLLLLPMIVIAAIAVRLDSPGPAFFRVDRVGLRGTRLRMLKFRKMHDDARGPALTMDDDERFTRLGPLLAKLKLDEIPQLWHVLTGEMSLVGPRPESAQFVELHEREYHSILDVPPGITGLSQIAFAEESRILDDDDPVQHYVGMILPQKVSLDLMYARDRSFWLNMRILLWTAAAVVMRRQVAVHRASGSMNLRKR